MTWGLVVAGVGAAVGGIAASSASKSAASTQAGSAAAATQAQKDMFDKQVELQQPWLQAGQAGLNRLQYLLGLSPGTTNTAAPAAPAQASSQASVQQASSGYSPAQAPAAAPAQTGPFAGFPTIGLNGGGGTPGPQQFVTVYQEDGAGNMQPVRVPVGGSAPASNPGPQAQSTTAMGMANGTANGGMDHSTDPAYGSLLKTFGVSDFQSDPGYQFRQSEGEKALQRAASVQGGIGSGKFLKDAMNYNQGLASQDYGAAFDRFNVGQTNQFNRLAALSGIGQTAANQTGSAASNFGSQIGSNIIGAGNAMAAGQVGSANAFNNAIGQGTSMYQQNQLMNRLFPSSYGGSGISGGGGFGTGSAYGNQDYGQYV